MLREMAVFATTQGAVDDQIFQCATRPPHGLKPLRSLENTARETSTTQATGQHGDNARPLLLRQGRAPRPWPSPATMPSVRDLVAPRSRLIWPPPPTEANRRLAAESFG